jgi:hypothetical protein
MPPRVNPASEASSQSLTELSKHPHLLPRALGSSLTSQACAPQPRLLLGRRFANDLAQLIA